MGEKPPRRGVTRHLNMDDIPAAPPKSGTGPLEYAMPWIIEFRVIGTASMMQVLVTESMTMGRGDKDKKRTPDIDLQPYQAYEMGVSRHHAVITARNSRVTIRDLNSSNGTFLNDGRLEPEKEYRLHHGDVLRLGMLELQVLFVVMPSSYEKNATPYINVEIPKIGNGQKVMVLDNDEQVAQMIGHVLTKSGFSVITVSHITQALSMVQETMPQAIVLEWMFPDGTGLQLVNYVRSQSEDLPLVVVSSASGGYQMGQAIDAGVDVFLTKPVGIDELLRGFGKILPQMEV